MSKKPKLAAGKDAAENTGWYPKPPAGKTEMVHSFYGSMVVRRNKDGKKG